MKGTTKCQCGCGKDINEKFKMILEALDAEIQAKTGKQIDIISGARCSVHNLKVGGTANSSHVHGIAADIAIYDSAFAYHLFKAVLNNINIKRIGDNYDLGNTLHIDIGLIEQGYPQEVIWSYKPKRK